MTQGGIIIIAVLCQGPTARKRRQSRETYAPQPRQRPANSDYSWRSAMPNARRCSGPRLNSGIGRAFVAILFTLADEAADDAGNHVPRGTLSLAQRVGSYSTAQQPETVYSASGRSQDLVQSFVPPATWQQPNAAARQQLTMETSSALVLGADTRGHPHPPREQQQRPRPPLKPRLWPASPHCGGRQQGRPGETTGSSASSHYRGERDGLYTRRSRCRRRKNNRCASYCGG